MEDDSWLGPLRQQFNLICCGAFATLAALNFGRWVMGAGDTSFLDWSHPLFIAWLEFEIAYWKRRAAVWFDLCRDHGFVSRKGL